ncbi:hypothetical protein BOTBODRAFT_182016, partial [Botryobasidium botryosum FD-172 SS1]
MQQQAIARGGGIGVRHTGSSAGPMPQTMSRLAQQQAAATTARSLGMMSHQQPGQAQLTSAMAAQAQQGNPFPSFMGANSMSNLFDQSKRNLLSPELHALTRMSSDHHGHGHAPPSLPRNSMAAHLAHRGSAAVSQLGGANGMQLQQLMIAAAQQHQHQQQLHASAQGMHASPHLPQQFSDLQMSAQILANISAHAQLSLPQLIDQREAMARRKAELQKTIDLLDGHIRSGASQGDPGPRMALVKHRQDHEILNNAELHLANLIQHRVSQAAQPTSSPAPNHVSPSQGPGWSQFQASQFQQQQQQLMQHALQQQQQQQGPNAQQQVALLQAQAKAAQVQAQQQQAQESLRNQQQQAASSKRA